MAGYNSVEGFIPQSAGERIKASSIIETSIAAVNTNSTQTQPGLKLP